MKRAFTVLVPGFRPFTMIMMEEANPDEVVRSIWPLGRIAA